MAGEFTSSYQRTKYWLDLLWPEHKKRQQQEQAEQEQAEQEQQQDPSRLKEADFEGGFRYEATENGSYEVQQYPTGRYIGEIRQTEDGTWETRHRGDAEWEAVDYSPTAAPQGQQGQDQDVDEQNKRTLAAEHLEQRHCGEVEAGLIQRGVYLDYDALYSLDTLHNAQNAIDNAVPKHQVDAYMRHHTDPAAQPNEHTVAVEAVPGSTEWNTAEEEVRTQILTTSPWANEQAQKNLHQQANQQPNQQLATSGAAASTQGLDR